MEKKLLIIPVAHSEAEMGSLRNDISQIIEGAMGWDRRERHREEVYTFWKKLKELLERILKDVDMEKVKIYQDGIPVGGELGVKLVEECARMGAKISGSFPLCSKKVRLWRRLKMCSCLRRSTRF